MEVWEEEEEEEGEVGEAEEEADEEEEEGEAEEELQVEISDDMGDTSLVHLSSPAPPSHCYCCHHVVCSCRAPLPPCYCHQSCSSRPPARYRALTGPCCPAPSGHQHAQPQLCIMRGVTGCSPRPAVWPTPVR